MNLTLKFILCYHVILLVFICQYVTPQQSYSTGNGWKGEPHNYSFAIFDTLNNSMSMSMSNPTSLYGYQPSEYYIDNQIFDNNTNTTMYNTNNQPMPYNNDWTEYVNQPITGSYIQDQNKNKNTTYNGDLLTNQYNMEKLVNSTNVMTETRTNSPNQTSIMIITTQAPLWKDANPYFGLPQYYTTSSNTFQNVNEQNFAAIPLCSNIPQVSNHSCNIHVRRYYFNEKTNECESFIHTYCEDGVETFFSTYNHCVSTCKVYYKNTLVNQESVELKDNIEGYGNYSQNTPIDSNINPIITSIVKFTIVQIWDDRFDSEQQFSLIKAIRNKTNDLYNNYSKYKATFIDIRPYPDEIIPVNLTRASIKVIHHVNDDPLEPIINATLNRRMSPLVVLRGSWVSEIEKNDSKDKILNGCNRMDIPMSIDCNTSRYGCCYDGVIAAAGLDKLGCPEKNCPCKEFMVSFGVTNDITKQIQLDYKWALRVSDQFIKELNKTYDGELKDSFIDWRDCVGRLKANNKTLDISIIDLALLLRTAHKDPFKPIFDLFNREEEIGGLSIIKNSLIISHAYAANNNNNKIPLYEPILHLDFNEKENNNGNINKRAKIYKNSYCGNALDLSTQTSGRIFKSQKFFRQERHEQLTVAFWIYNTKHYQQPTNLTNILWARNGYKQIDQWPLFYIKGNQMIANFLSNNQSITCSDVWNDEETKNIWTHIVITYSSLEGRIKLYQDGNPLRSCSNQTLVSQPLAPIKEIIVGDSSKNVAHRFLDELFIYKEILSHTSIKELYQKCANTTHSLDTNQTCDSECPPPLTNIEPDVIPNKDIGNHSHNNLFPIRTCLEYQTRCSRFRSGIYEAVNAKNQDGSSYVTDTSIFTKNNIYCDMNTEEGGWELILNNINGDGWSSAQILERDMNYPSLNSSFSKMGKFVNFLYDDSIVNKQYMILIDKNEYKEGGIWNVSDNNSIVLHKKYGDWNNGSNINLRVPYIFDDGHDLFITTSSNPKNDPFGTLASTIGLVEPYLMKNFDLIFGISLWIRYEFKNSTKNSEIFDEMNQTEIEQYYLNVEIINPLGIEIIVYYDITEEKKWIEVNAYNRTSLFNIIHSISMPLSVGFTAYEKKTLKQLYVNGRSSFESPISYLPNDFVIMIISDNDDRTDKPIIQSFSYDYIFYNPLSFPINVTVNFLNMSPAEYLIMPGRFENWKTRFYSPSKIDFKASAKTNVHDIQLFIEGKPHYLIQPMIPNLNTTIVLSVSDKISIKPQHMCHTYLNMTNTLPYSLDTFWRDDALLLTLKPREDRQIHLIFNYSHEIANILKNITIYSCVHGRFYDAMCDIQIDGREYAPITCSEFNNAATINLVLSSRKSHKRFQDELTNIKYDIYALGGENICPPEVNGGYSNWTEWTECFTDKNNNYNNLESYNSTNNSQIKQVRSRFRICNNPPPKNGGIDCDEQLKGSSIETEICKPDNSIDINLPNRTDKPNLISKPIDITLINDIDGIVLVIWEILLNTNQTWQRGNIVLNKNDTRTISINNTEILNSGTISLTAKNLATNEILLLRDSKRLTLQLDLIQKNIIVEIGQERINILRRFYAQFIVMNEGNNTASISLSKDGTLLSSSEDIPPNGRRITFKYSFVSLTSNPSPIIVQAYCNETSLFVNGLQKYIIKLSSSQFDYIVIKISQKMSRFQVEQNRFINFIVNNMNPTEDILLRINHNLIPQRTFILGPTNMISVYRKIILPQDYLAEPVEILIKKNFDRSWKTLVSLPLLDKSTFIEFIPVKADLTYKYDLKSHIYNLNIRVSNMGKVPAKTEWRRNVPEQVINPGNEIRVSYYIRSPSTLPVFIIRAYDAINDNDLHINGKNISHLITANQSSNMTNTFLISAISGQDENYNESSEKLYIKFEMYNFLSSRKVFLTIFWNDTYYESIEMSPYNSVIANYTVSNVNDIIIVQAMDEYEVPVTVNGTYRLGLPTYENNSAILLYVGDLPSPHYLGLRLSNIYKRNNITVHWSYKNKINNATFNGENEIELIMRLQSVDIKPLTIWITQYNRETHWSIKNLSRVILTSNIIRNSMSTSLENMQWITLPIGSVILHPNASDMSGAVLNNTINIVLRNTHINEPIHLFTGNPTEETYEYISLSQPKDNEIITLACVDYCSGMWNLFTFDNHGQVFYVDQRHLLEFKFLENGVKNLTPSGIRSKYYLIEAIVKNTLWTPVIFSWEANWEGKKIKHQAYIEPQGQLDITNDVSYLYILLGGKYLNVSAKKYDNQEVNLFVNGTEIFALNHTKIPNGRIYLTVDDNGIVPIDNLINTTEKWKYPYTVLLDNTLELTVKTLLNDKIYYIEPKGMLEINLNNPNQNRILSVVLNAYENITQFPLLLNGTMGKVEFNLGRSRPATFIKITPPHLPSLPKSSYVFLELNNEARIKDEPTLRVHGTLLEYKDVKNKSMGVLFTGDKSWVGTHLTGANCIIGPTFCSKGFTISLRLMIPSSEATQTNRLFILDSGGHGGSSTGVALTLENNKSHFQVTTLSKTWMVNTYYPRDTLFTIIASWQPESGLYLYIDGTLVSSEHNGEMLFSTQDLDINPNLLIGRNINGNNVKFSTFVLQHITIFDKYFNQQEALMTYLQLLDSRRAKAQFNQLRILNQLERPVKLEVSTNGKSPNKVLIPQTSHGDILTLIDMNRTNEEISKEKHVRIPISRYVTISASDSELAKPLYINNHPSPIRLSLENDYMEYADIVLSAPTKIAGMMHFWTFFGLSQDGRLVEGSSPIIKTYGNVIESQIGAPNSTLALDGVSGYMQIEKFKELECFTQPLLCEKGFTLVTTLRMNEVINDDNNPHFVLDTGGHNGKGFSLFYLGGRLLAEISQNRKVWKIETRLIIGEWITVSITWNPLNGGQLKMMINGNDYKKVDKSSDLQGASSYNNNTFMIGKPVIESSGRYGKFFIRQLAVTDLALEENDLIDYFLFYHNHNKKPSDSRYISVNFQNRAGQDIILKPDRGEHQPEGYLINAGLMLELRLEEKGVVTTYPIVFKALGLASDKSYLLNNDWSLVVNAEEDPSVITNVIITTALSCPKEEGLFPDPNDKTKFISCRDEIARREKCPPNSQWNDDIKSCTLNDYKINKPHIELLNKSDEGFEKNPIYFILKNTTPKNVTFVRVYDSADAFNVGPYATLLWQPKSHLRYPTAFVALEGAYRDENLKGRLLINGHTILLLNSSPFANKTIFILHDKETDWRQEMFNFMKKLYGSHTEQGNITKKKTDLIMANLVDENIHIYNNQNIIVEFDLSQNEIAKIKIEDTIPSKEITFLAYGATGSHEPYLINNMSTYIVKYPQEYGKNQITAINVAVIHKRNDSNWYNVYQKLVSLQKEAMIVSDKKIENKNNRSNFELTLRINLMTPLDVTLREVTGTNFKVGLRSELAKKNIATDLQLSVNISGNHRMIFSVTTKDGDDEKKILINGLTEWQVGEISNITGSIIPAVIHELGQDWIGHFNALIETLNSNMTSKSQILPYSLLWNYPQLFHLTVKFYNNIDGDVIIKSLKGILNITTSFPAKSTGTIDLYIPENAVVTFIAQDINQNHLYLDNNQSVSVSVSSPIYHLVMITRYPTIKPGIYNTTAIDKSLPNNEPDNLMNTTNFRKASDSALYNNNNINNIKYKIQDINLGGLGQIFS